MKLEKTEREITRINHERQKKDERESKTTKKKIERGENMRDKREDEDFPNRAQGIKRREK